MEDNRPVQNRLLFRVMRVLAGAMAGIAGLAISYACITALLGDTAMLIDFIDDEADALVLDVPTMLAILSTNICALVSLGLLFFSMNRFLAHAGRGELLIDSARAALRRMGIAMLLLYLTTRLLAILIPICGIPGFWTENALSLPFLFVDLDFLYLLVGTVLMALGQALREGQAAKEEAKQYV